ncbi:MAG: alpha-amylase [Desulfurococcaceae archaeon]
MKNKRILIDALNKYLLKTRWWPWKNVLKEISIVDYEEIDSFKYIIFRVEDKYFQLPLLETSNIPETLESRSFCINNNCFVEAEYCVDYLNYFSRLSKHSVEFYDKELFQIYSAEPLSLETTNVTVIYETNLGKIVLKNYRLIPRVNLEYLILRKLVEKNYRNIPRIIAFLKYREFTTGILMYFIESTSDGGKPFYESFINRLNGLETYSFDKRLSTKLGFIISEMHKALNYGVENSFYGVEEISDSDIELWINRCERYYRNSLSNIDNLIEKQEGLDRFQIEFWRNLYDKMSRDLFDNVVNLMKKQYKLLKGRIHQDLHLAQMRYIEDRFDFVITDFEGEPGRNDDERLLKEPLLRDLASMIRSFQYLTHSALSNVLNLSIHETSIRLLKNDPSVEWRKFISKILIEEYLSNILDLKIISNSMEEIRSNYWIYVKPWLIERALYEIYYESLYRPNWISIPLTGLYQVLYIN